MKSFFHPLLAALAIGLTLVPVIVRGAGMNINNAVERLDKLVHLTAAQKAQATDIFTGENDALQAIASPEDRLVEGMPIRQNARGQIRALLTPEQQQKFDANPNGAEDLEERAFVGSFLKSSPAIAARLGTITRLTLAGSTVTIATTDEQIQARAGSYAYRVQGSAGAETFKVYWVKRPPEPFKIVKIEGKAGETIQP